MRSLLKFAVVIVLCVGITVPCWSGKGVDSASSERDLAISLTGLPSNVGSTRLMVRAIDLSTGAVKAIFSDELSSPVYMTVPSDPLLMVVSTMSPRTPERYQGMTSLYAGESLDLTMKLDGAKAEAPASRRIFSQTPSRRGKAIGYSPDRFSASGTGNDKGLSKGLMDLFVSNMVEQSTCYDNDSDSSYVMVETANPEKLADIEAELSHHGDPAFDPETTVESNLIEPTHMGQGTITDNGTTVTVNIQIVDKDGNVVSSVSKTGSSSALFDTISKVTGELSAQMCKEKEWKGTIGVEEHTSIFVPNTDPEKPGASISGDLSVHCNVTGSDADCTVHYSDSITGEEGSSSTQGSGIVETGATVSVSGDTVIVGIGLFNLLVTSTSSFGGGSHTGQSSIQMGGWRVEGKALPDPNNQSGSAREGDMVFSWNLKRN